MVYHYHPCLFIYSSVYSTYLYRSRPRELGELETMKTGSWNSKLETSSTNSAVRVRFYDSWICFV